MDWHALALKLYVDEQQSFNKTWKQLNQAGQHNVTRSRLRWFLGKQAKVLRSDAEVRALCSYDGAPRGWVAVHRADKQCDHCHQTFMPRGTKQRWCLECCPTYEDRKRMSAYGLTKVAFDALLQRANGRCEICGVQTDKHRIDHDHKTGVVRGLLCDGCNVRLGWYETFTQEWNVAVENYLALNAQR